MMKHLKLMLFFAFIVTFLTNCDEDDELVLPPVTAGFTSSALDDQGNVQFTNTSTGAATYDWDFGDGNSSDEVNPAHQYAASGTYNVSLTARTTVGNSNTISNSVSVTIVVLTPPFDGGLVTNGDFEAGAAPWIVGVDDNAPAPVVTEDGNTYYSSGDIANPDAGQPFLVNLSQKLGLTDGTVYTLTFDAWSDRSRAIIAGIGRSDGDFANDNETVDITDTRATYSVVLVANGFGEPNNRVLFDVNGEEGVVNIDNVNLVEGGEVGEDTNPPVITLSGSVNIGVVNGEMFSDPGATATDDIDGDISANIVVGGDAVDTNVDGTYVITYNVSDAAGNAAAEVKRTVIVAPASAFNSGLLINGDFEAGAAPWIQGVDDAAAAPTVTMDDNTYYSSGDIASPDAAQPFLVNLSQKLALMDGTEYTLTFDAWSDRSRSIIAGLGRSGGDFANVTESVSITDTRATYSVLIAVSGFGESDNRVLFDLNGEAGVVNIDNVALVEGDVTGGGEDTTAPEITLVGNSIVNINIGDTYSDPGATATDDTDGDISANITVDESNVNTAAAGSYTVTYNVSDAAGNAAAEVTRTVIVNDPNEAFDDGLLTNGDFEAGAAPWIVGVDDAAAAPTVTMDGNTYYSSGDIASPNASEPFLVNVSQKLEITQGTTYTLSFEAWSDRSRAIIAGIGQSEAPFMSATEIVNITDTRTKYTVIVTAVDFGEANNRVLFDVNGEAGVVNIDNVSLVAND